MPCRRNRGGFETSTAMDVRQWETGAGRRRQEADPVFGRYPVPSTFGVSE
jgi:hypothetical protein